MGNVMNTTPVSETETELAWVTRLREAGYDVRTGSGELNRDPDASFDPPPGVRFAITRFIRNLWRDLWNGPIYRLTHPKRNASLP
jgi:hypothetical protein